MMPLNNNSISEEKNLRNIHEKWHEDFNGIEDDAISISSDESDEGNERNINNGLNKMICQNADYNKIIRYLTDDSTLLSIETGQEDWKPIFDAIEKCYGAKSTESPNRIIGNVNNYGLRWCDLMSLNGTNWLNDNIVNSFMTVLQEKCRSLNIDIDVIDTIVMKKEFNSHQV